MTNSSDLRAVFGSQKDVILPLKRLSTQYIHHMYIFVSLFDLVLLLGFFMLSAHLIIQLQSKILDDVDVDVES